MGCDYLYMLQSKINCASKMDPKNALVMQGHKQVEQEQHF